MLVGGLVAFGAYKMSKKDADRVQQHTGVDPEELDDAELEDAMRELNIKEQKVTSEDLEQGGEPAAARAPAASGGGSSDYLAELETLAGLRDRGVLTDEEFEAKKRQILGIN